MESESASKRNQRMEARRNFLKTVGVMALSFLAACLGKSQQSERISQGNIQPESMTPEGAETPSAQAELSRPPQAVETVSSTVDASATPDIESSPTTRPIIAQNGECASAHVITSLCLRDGACIEVCPVDCIIPGYPVEEWPWFYIDPDACIDCGACIPECPHEAIFPSREEVPSAYIAKGGEYINRVGLSGHYEGLSYRGNLISLDSVRQLEEGEIVDLTEDLCYHSAFFENGPGYEALDQWEEW